MEILSDCGAVLDVHNKTVLAGSRRIGPSGQAQDPVRTFGTMAGNLLGPADWLASHGVVHAALGSTGGPWEPLSHRREDRSQVPRANPQHIKPVPGRKADVEDCRWIAPPLQPGSLRASLVPPADAPVARPDPAAGPVGRRTRGGGQPDPGGAGGCQDQAGRRGIGGPGRLRSRHERRLDRGRDRAGPTGRGLARRRLRGKVPQLRRALHGRVTEHHRFLLRTPMGHARPPDDLIERPDHRIEAEVGPFSQAAPQAQGSRGVMKNHRAWRRFSYIASAASSGSRS
jgi:transposase